jgi:cytochrome c5
MWRTTTIGIVTCLAAISLLFACNKQEEPKVAATQQPTASEQKSPDMANSSNQGEKVYQGTCSTCHEAGASEAPKLGDKSDWSRVLAKDKELLVQNALNGIGAMPAKGGNPSLSEDDIRAAVDYMIEQSR